MLLFMPEMRTSDDPNHASKSPTDDTLPAALVRHQIELEDAAIGQLTAYCRVLWEWNEKINLTRHTDYEIFVARDVVDSLALSRFLKAGQKVLDVGTGGGVPGVVLAIVRPDLHVALLESVGKKARAVTDMVERLKLGVPVHHARVQDYLEHADVHFDVLVARAVGRLDKLLTWLEPFWDRFDRLLLIKGPRWVEERKAVHELGLLEDKDLRRLLSYPLPGADGESVVLEIREKESISDEAS